ncbi:MULTISPECIES: WxL domain-containing protein [unclassified Enterococcus]|uniref:WxL domain-containing protein n=1 Tax=unclassified Enterococcus TaxID=2608891 RepID=UPI0013EA6083|nr:MULTISPECIES: WxL domain-containing protein [unclassified Enterococcus]
MRKNMIGTLLVSTILLGGLATPVFAEGEAKSTGDITFTEPTDTVEPLDPTDPTQPVEPEDPENPATGQTGPLTLDVVPNLPFGTHEIESGTKTYPVDAAKNDSPYLQVSDRRGVGADGQAQGWNVTVSVSDFLNGTQKLEGAELNFGTATSKSTPDNDSTAPQSQTITGLSSASAATPIFVADKDQGLGTWLSVYDPANITLKVPKAAAGTFTADLTWNLVAGPVA